VIFSTQVPDMLKNTPKHVKVLYQPNLESTQNQPRFLRLKFWALDSSGAADAFQTYSKPLSRFFYEFRAF
jgi:hypothetical protein